MQLLDLKSVQDPKVHTFILEKKLWAFLGMENIRCPGFMTFKNQHLNLGNWVKEQTEGAEL